MSKPSLALAAILTAVLFGASAQAGPQSYTTVKGKSSGDTVAAPAGGPKIGLTCKEVDHLVGADTFSFSCIQAGGVGQALRPATRADGGDAAGGDDAARRESIEGVVTAFAAMKASQPNSNATLTVLAIHSKLPSAEVVVLSVTLER